MKVNSDLGESYGHWKMGFDAQVMPMIDQANIACGFHAGDPDVMAETLALAVKHQVQIGAHPAYPDLQGFGRRSMKLSRDSIKNLVLYQISALDGLAQSLGALVEYVKPHGALYNDMMRDTVVFESVLDAVQAYHRPLCLMLQSMPDNQKRIALAQQRNIPLIFEVFADRRYTDEGLLTPRTQSNAVLSLEEVEAQVRVLVSEGKLYSESGKSLFLPVDSICVHGDDATSLEKAKLVSRIVKEHMAKRNA